MPMTAASEEVMMPTATAEAMRLAEIQAMRQLADSVTQQSKQFSTHMEAQTRVMEKMTDRLEDVRERVIALEQGGYDKRLEAVKAALEKLQTKFEASLAILEGRTNTLESQRDMAKGAVSFWEWLSKNIPWLITLGVGAAAAFGIKKS